MLNANRRSWLALAVSALLLVGLAQPAAAQDSSLQVELIPEGTTYQAPDTIRLSLSLRNKGKAALSLTPKRGGMLDLGVYFGKGRAFLVQLPNPPSVPLVLAPGQEKLFNYEIPTRRVVVYGPYAPPEGKFAINVQGPWFNEIKAMQRVEITIKLPGVWATSKPEKTPASQPADPLAVTLSKHMQRADFQTGVTQLVAMTPEECQPMIGIEAVKNFLTANKEFDGIVYDHSYSMGRWQYVERIVVLGSYGMRVKTVVIRTWGHLQGEKSSRVLETKESAVWHGWGKLAQGTARYSVQRKEDRNNPNETPITVIDQMTGSTVFEATHGWRSVGVMNVPRQQNPSEIQKLSEEQVDYITSLNRTILIKWTDTQRELEETMAALGFRLQPNPYDEKVRFATVIIPSQMDREKAVAALKKEKKITVIDRNSAFDVFMMDND